MLTSDVSFSLRSQAAIVVLAVVSSAGFAPLHAQTKKDPVSSGTIARLIEELGSDSFAARERATKRLAKIGNVARKQLENAAKSPNLERRTRANRILREEIRREDELKLKAFLTDSAGEQKYNFPGWSQFRKIAGDGRKQRRLFASMLRKEPALLAGINDRLSLRKRIDDRFTAIESTRLSQPVTLEVPTIATFVLICSLNDVPSDRLLVNNLTRVLLRASPNLNSSRYREPFGNLVAAWLTRKGIDDNQRMDMLSIADTFSLGDAAMALSGKLLKRQWRQAERAAFLPRIFDRVGRFGDTDDVKLLRPYFNDDTVCLPMDVPLEVRDVALLNALRLKKRKLEDFGLDSSSLRGFIPSRGFASTKARAAAFAKFDKEYPVEKLEKTNNK